MFDEDDTDEEEAIEWENEPESLGKGKKAYINTT